MNMMKNLIWDYHTCNIYEINTLLHPFLKTKEKNNLTYRP